MTADLYKQRYWAEIDLDRLAANYRQTQKMVPSHKLLCVLKADAYGHGSVETAKTLAAAGAPYFGVATAEEALQLRRNGITTPVLILGMVSPKRVSELADNNIAVTIGDMAAAREYNSALGPDRQLTVHVKIDTGVNRIGLKPDAAAGQIAEMRGFNNFNIEGVFTHFSAAEDDREREYTLNQIKLFGRVVAELAGRNIKIPFLHCANSAAIVDFSSPQYDSIRAYINMSRPGIVLYGINPCHKKEAELLSVMSLRARVMKTAEVGRGESVGYNRAWRAPRDSIVAVVGAGYGDGLPRSLSGKLPVLINGRRAAQIGHICMDACMLDVTDIPGVKAGDTATLLGADGGGEITFGELCRAGGVSSAEIMNALGKRVPRIYLRDGKAAAQTCYINYL